MNRKKAGQILILIAIISAVMAGQVLAQSSVPLWSAFDMGFGVSKSSNTEITSIAGQAFVGATQDLDTRIESGFLADPLLRGILVGVFDQRELPSVYSLKQNYPNPFNPSTVIHYSLPVKSYVRLTVYDVLGREVGTLVDGLQEAGEKSVSWNASDASGVYFCRMQAGEFVGIKKMVVVR